MQRPTEFARTFANAEGRQRYEEIWSEMIDGIIGRLPELRTHRESMEKLCADCRKDVEIRVSLNVVLNHSFPYFDNWLTYFNHNLGRLSTFTSLGQDPKKSFQDPSASGFSSPKSTVEVAAVPILLELPAMLDSEFDLATKTQHKGSI